MKNTCRIDGSTKTRTVATMLAALSLLVLSSNSHAVTCRNVDPDSLTEAAESKFDNTPNTPQAAIPGPITDASRRTVFLDYLGVPGGYFGAILSDGWTAFRFESTWSVPYTKGGVATAVESLNAKTKNLPKNLRMIFKKGHLINSYVGGNPQAAKGYTVLTPTANTNHDATVESFMKLLNQEILIHYFRKAILGSNKEVLKVKDFVATGTDSNGNTVNYSPAYYYEMIIDHSRTLKDDKANLMPSWSAMGLTDADLQKIPSYYDMTIRVVMVEYNNAQPPVPTGRVMNMPAEVFDQFLVDTGIGSLPDFKATPTQQPDTDGFYYRPGNGVVGTKTDAANQTVNFRLNNVGH